MALVSTFPFSNVSSTVEVPQQVPAPPGSLYMRHKPDYYMGRILHSRQSAKHNPGPHASWFTVSRVTWIYVRAEDAPDGGTFPVRKILAYRKHPIKGHQYLVRWIGYPTEASTWEPYRYLKDAEAMDDWEKRQGRIL